MPNSTQITTNYEKAVEVAQKAIGMLERKIYPFNLPDLFPDAIVPEGIEAGSKEHALISFVACSLDAMERSELVYEKTRKLASERDLSQLIKTETPLAEVLKDYFGKGVETSMLDPVKTLSRNLRQLEFFYQGDPRKLKEETIERTLKNICNFHKYGPGKSALLIKNFVRFGIWDFPPFEIPIKIDRHVKRISIGTGIIQFPENQKDVRYSALDKPLKQVYNEITKNKHISAIGLDDAFWAIGSKLCKINRKSYCHGNCTINCNIRPYLDKKTTYFHLRDMRKQDGESLFPFKGKD